MNAILFDGDDREQLLPLTYTRPVSEIRCGIFTLREKWEKYLGTSCSWLTVGYLQDKYPQNDSSDNLYIRGNCIPDDSLVNAIRSLKQDELLKHNGDVIALRTHQKVKEYSTLDKVDGSVIVEYDREIERISRPWQVFQYNPDQIRTDMKWLPSPRKTSRPDPSNQLINEGDIYIDSGAVATGSILNAANGPIYLGKNSTVMEGSVIRGPFAMGENSVVKMGARIYEGSSLGPHCKVAGELNNVVFTGYSSKQHDGFLGNSVIGEWCNLGAGTNNSNLKNNYKEVKLWDYSIRRFTLTGLQFCGLIMGDHSKCGINTMFNTGTVVGVSANIFGAGFPRNFIPSFSWGGAHGLTEYKLSSALEVAEIVMGRRNLMLSEHDRKILEQVYLQSARFRKQAGN